MLHHLVISPLASALVALAPPAPPSGLDVSYVYSLSTTSGVVPLASVSMSYDREHKELFVIGDGLVRIFNASGMEVYTFGQDPEVGSIYSVAAVENGDLLATSFLDGKMSLVRCNFRGELIAKVELRGLPAEFAGGLPPVLRYANGKIYLADLGQMKVLVLEPDGTYVTSYDLAALLELQDKREETGIRGFNVDKDGNILFTIQPLFKAYVLSADGKIRGFGRKGSGPGKFNVVGGIARDDAGNLYVVDILKCAVVVFDRDFNFVREFGYRGPRPGNLVAPEEVAAGEGKVYVAQNARRGVSVFKVAQE